MPAGSLFWSSSTRPGTGCRRRSSSRAGPNRRAAASASRPSCRSDSLRSLGDRSRNGSGGSASGPGSVRVVPREPSRQRPAHTAARLDGVAARARLPARELVRRRPSPRRCVVNDWDAAGTVSVSPLPRAAIRRRRPCAPLAGRIRPAGRSFGIEVYAYFLPRGHARRAPEYAKLLRSARIRALDSGYNPHLLFRARTGGAQHLSYRS